MNPRVRQMLNWLTGAVAVAVVLLALLVSVFRVVVPQVPAYRGEVVAWASGVLGAPVAVHTLDLQWRRLRPELVLERVTFVSADARSAVAAREVRVGISLRTLLQSGRFAPAVITLLDPDITLVIEEQDAGASRQDWQRAFSTGEHRGELIVSRGHVTLLADAGRRRLEISGLDLRVASDGVRHRIRATGRLKEEIGGLVRLRGDAVGWPGDGRFSADLNFEARSVDLVGLQTLGRSGRVEGGQMDASVTLMVADDSAQRLGVELVLSGVHWSAGVSGAARRVERAVTGLDWTRRETGWEAALRRLEVSRPGGARISGPVLVVFDEPIPVSATALWTVESGRVELDDLLLLGEALPFDAGADLQRLLERAPSGTVERGLLTVRRGIDGPASFRAELSATDLALEADAAGGIPGFSGIDVSLEADEGSGTLRLVQRQGALVFATLFRDALEVSEGLADVSWTRDDEGWQVTTRGASMKNRHISVSGDAEFHAARNAPLWFSVSALFEDADISAKSRYLPVGIMEDDLVEWLDRSVVAGTATGGTALVEGYPEDFTLDVRFDAERVELEFIEDWPALADARVAMWFTHRGFGGQVLEGSFAGAPVLRATVTMEDYLNGVLDIDASAGEDLGRMFAGFQRTPVGDAEWLRGASAAGHARLDLRVLVDLQDGASTSISGSLSLDDASFAVGGFDHPLSGLRGRVTIMGDGFAAEGVRGRLLGETVAVSARTLRDSAGAARAVEVSLGGELDLPLLQRLSDNDDLPMNGRTEWQARVLVPLDDGQVPLLQVESDLLGLAVDLPDPVGKIASDRHPMLLQMELAGERRRLLVESRGRLRLDATLTEQAGEWRFAGGRVHLGAGEMGAAPDTGFAVTGGIEAWQLALDALVPALADMTLPVSSVDLRIGTLTAWGHTLGEVELQGRRTLLGWHWLLEGPRLSGSLDLPDAPTDDRPVRADFARLDMPLTERVRPDLPAHADPSTLPPIAFHVGSLRLGAMNLGEVNGYARPVMDGVQLEGFTATRGDMRMTLDASWHMVDGHHRTVVRGSVDSTDVRATLSALGYVAAVEAAVGHLQVNVAWADTPLSNPLETVTGSVSVRMERGMLQDLDPGAGRIFGLLSLNALPRRLALDFSDFFRRGLAFDTIQGSFDIREGQAWTEDLRLLGPAAKVEITGRTGLATRDYDQQAVVVGSLASSLTLAGALVGGPAVGAAMLVFSEILRGPLEEMARVRYHMTGPWEQPVIERIPDPPRESR